MITTLRVLIREARVDDFECRLRPEPTRYGNATGSKELEAEGLRQEAKGAELLRDDGATAVEKSLNDHTISIVAAILILTVLIQVILVKSWT